MIIKISEDLGKEEIWANGMELSNIMGMDFVGGKRVSSYPSNSKKYIYTFTNYLKRYNNIYNIEINHQLLIEEIILSPRKF